MLSKNQIKEIQFLHIKKHRDKEKLFIAEGVKICLEIINLKPQLMKYIFCTQHFFENHKSILQKFSSLLKFIDEADLRKISLQENPNEVLIVASYFENQNSNINFDSSFSLYLDDIRDPGNLGTILRLADWYGLTEIYASAHSCDLYNPKVIQASMGAVLRVNIKYDSLSNIIQLHQIKNVYGAVLNGHSIYNEKMKGGLIVIGNEANGIDKENLSLINHPITIPSSPFNGTESLNAAMATAIIVSEFYRQLKA